MIAIYVQYTPPSGVVVKQKGKNYDANLSMAMTFIWQTSWKPVRPCERPLPDRFRRPLLSVDVSTQASGSQAKYAQSLSSSKRYHRSGLGSFVTQGGICTACASLSSNESLSISVGRFRGIYCAHIRPVTISTAIIRHFHHTPNYTIIHS